jgi:hypothetical protein
VRDGGDDEVDATGTMAPRGRRARDDTKRTELPRGQFSFPSAVHRTARSENLGRRRVRFSRKSKGDSGVSPTALFRKAGREKPLRKIPFALVGGSLTLIEDSGNAAAARDIMTVIQIRIPNDLGARDRDVRDVTSNGARLTTTRPST